MYELELLSQGPVGRKAFCMNRPSKHGDGVDVGRWLVGPWVWLLLASLWGCARPVEQPAQGSVVDAPRPRDLGSAARARTAAVRLPPAWMRTATLEGTVKSSGGNLAGATVGLQLLLGAGRTRTLGAGTSDKQGHYSFARLPPGAYRLTCRKAGLGARRLSLWVHEGENRASTLVMGRSAPVAGVVVDDRDRPVLGARITITPRHGTPGVATVATTDARGRFMADGLHVGSHSLRAEADDHRPAGISRMNAPARGLRVRLVRLFKLEGKLQGKLPAGGKAVVRLAGSGLWPGRSVTAEKGAFVFEGVPSGVYEMVAWTEQTPWAASELVEGIQVGPRAPPEVTLKLLPAQRITGSVKHNGEPVPGAVVVLGNEHLSVLRNRTKTDAKGAFALTPVVAGSYHVGVWAKTFLPVLDKPLKVPRPGELVVELSRGAAVQGQVKDTRGFPLAGAAIWVVYRAGSGSGARSTGELGVVPGPVPPIPPADGWAPPANTRSMTNSATDATGRFTVTGLWPGKVRIIADREGYAQARSSWVKLERSGTVTLDRDLVLSPASTLSGRVLDQQGRGLPAVRLTITSETGERQTLSDARGLYEVRGVRGRLTVLAQARGYLPGTATMTLEEGARQQHDLILEAARGLVSGYVVGLHRLPVKDARVVATRGALKVKALTGASGHFSLEGVGGRPLTITVNHPGYLTLRRKVKPARRLELRLAYWAALRGKVQDHRTGVPVERFTVRVEKGRTADVRQVPSARRGEFDILGLSPAAVRVRIAARGYAARSLAVKLSSPSRIGDPGGTRHTVALHRAGVITGRLTSATGRDIKGAKVSAGGVTSTTTAGGKFRLSGVPEGSQVVKVSYQRQSLQSDPVVVRPDQVTGPVRLQLRPSR